MMWRASVDLPVVDPPQMMVNPRPAARCDHPTGFRRMAMQLDAE